ncbi:hypothetical protein C8J56DRAFT_936041 [Mycena floridula]|nr:hypothetical protein C8J56DRAFT_936041 [Mycena floridula]
MPPKTPVDLRNLGAGDSYLVEQVLTMDLAATAFATLRDEVQWHNMYHRGGEVPRLVAVQGEVLEDGSFPIYRHPADQSPPLRSFSPTIEKVIHHSVNHVLIQHYRSGKDYISEHSDKTIDVVRGSTIVNVSLGAQRVMTLKTKKDQLWAAQGSSEEESSPALTRTTQRFPLPHNSMFVMGPETNKRWLHGINHDNRPFKMKSEEEQQENGERISLTFRHIGTFLTGPDEKMIFGQGATGKTRETAQPVVNNADAAEALVRAFGNENHQSNFDWDRDYGQGSDVLHLTED